MTDHHRPAAFNEEAYEEIKRRRGGNFVTAYGPGETPRPIVRRYESAPMEIDAPMPVQTVQWLAIETWAWSISGDQVVFSVHTDDMALLAGELGLESAPKGRAVTVGVAVLMWVLLFALLGGTAWAALLMGGL